MEATSPSTFDIHDAEIMWDGHPCSILVDAADTTPLIGTSLLDVHELTIRFVDGGDVSIEAMNELRS